MAEKCVMVIDEALPTGLIGNTAAVMGVTLGRLAPEVVGGDVEDADGHTHKGITRLPIPILKGSAALIAGLREKLYGDGFEGVQVVDFTDVAQGCHEYAEYEGRIAAVPAGGLRYLGIALYGEKKQVDRLTGSLPLLR